MQKPIGFCVCGTDGMPDDPGIGFEDMDVIDADDGLAWRFARGDLVKDFSLPVVVERGVYRGDASYLRRNGVTCVGAFWIAQKDGPGKPLYPR